MIVLSIAAAFEHAFARLAEVSPTLLAAGLAFQALGLVLRGLAWRNVLRAAYPGTRVPAAAIAGSYVAGVAANGLLPAKGGELVKIGLARAHIERSSTVTIAGSLAVLTLFDGTVGTLLSCAVVATGSVPGVDPGRLIPSLPPGIVLLGAAAAVVSVIVVRGRVRRALAKRAREAGAALAVFHSVPGYLRNVASLQVLAWCCRVGVALSLLAAFHLPASVQAAVVVVVASGLAGLIPGMPGGLGAQQLALAYALGQTAATASIVSFSLGMQLSIVVLQIALGLAAVMLTMRVLHPARAVAAARALAR